MSVPDYDVRYWVEDLMKSTGARATSAAMGSQEGFTLVIAAASRQGSWVQQCILDAVPLGQLEKKLQILNPNRNSRLLLTMEANPSILVNILCRFRLIMNEPPPGVKANLLDSLQSTPPFLRAGRKGQVVLRFASVPCHDSRTTSLCSSCLEQYIRL